MKTIQRPSIYTQSPECLGYAFLSSSSNASFPAANDAIFLPFKLERPALIKRMFSVNGNVVSGNIDLGIYTRDGRRIVATGSTAQTKLTSMQFISITTTFINPGLYYLAIAMDNNTGVIRRFNISIIRQQHFGVLRAASAFPLPSSVTFATVNSTVLPNIGMELLGVP